MWTTPVRVFNTVNEALSVFSKDGCEAVIADRPVLEHFASLEANRGKSEVLAQKLTEEPLGFIFSRKRANLAREFNRALAEVRESGEYAALVDKWFGAHRP